MGNLRQRRVLTSVGAKRRKSWLLAASALAPLSLSLGVSESALARCSGVTTSRARTACRFLSSGLLATIALLAASTVSAHAQSNWTGTISNGWFNPLNWSPFGVPGVATNANIDTVTPNSTEIMGASATALNLAVGQNGTGRLVIQNGGTMTNIGGFIGNLPGSQGTVTVSGTWTNVGTLVVGGLGTGTLTIQDGGTVSSGGGGSIGLAAGSTGTVTVTGPGSTWNNSPVSPGGLNIGSFGNGSLTIANGGTVNNNTAFIANVGAFPGSTGTVIVTGAGSTWSNSSGVIIGNLGTGTLTIADGGIVNGPVTIASTAIAGGTLNIGAGAGSAPAAPGTLAAPSVAFGAGTGMINFNHTSTNYVFAPAISGPGTVNVLAGTTTFTGANTYSGPTNVDAGTLRAGATNTFSPNSPVTIASAGTLDLNGFNQTIPGVTNTGLVSMGTGTAPGTILTTTNYTGTGTIALNTFLGTDNSPSDKLVINGGSATGSSSLRITNAGGPGAETVANGIQVVQAINGGTSASGAFSLPGGSITAGAFDYFLFKGGASPGSEGNWYLRSTLIAPVTPDVPPPEAAPGTPPLPTPVPGAAPIPLFQPGVAVMSVVPSVARTLGLLTLGTFNERQGDQLLVRDGCSRETQDRLWNAAKHHAR